MIESRLRVSDLKAFSLEDISMNNSPDGQKIILLTPVFNDCASLKLLLPNIKEAVSEHQIEVVLVDDGSTQDISDVNLLIENGLSGCVVELRANVGQQAAIAVGLEIVHAKMGENDLLVIMDSDGEDPPHAINYLINKANELKKPVVASRSGRSATFAFMAGYQVFKIMFYMLTGRSINFGNFMCLSRDVVERLLAMPSLSHSLPGTLLLSKLSIEQLPINRSKRLVGQSHMNITGLVKHGTSCIRVFRKDVVIRLVLLSLLLTLCLLVTAFAILAIKLYGIAVSGWASLALGIVGIFILQVLGFLFLAAITVSDLQTKASGDINEMKIVKNVTYS